MSDRDRLIELVEDGFPERYEVVFRKDIEKLADHLLANGVMVPPCKVGETMYVLLKNGFPDKTYGYKKGVNEIEVLHIRKRKDGIFVSDFLGFIDWKVGERAFLTKEEAEQALKELTDND